MRILNFFMHPLFPVAAGNQCCTYEMCKELARNGHEVGLIHLDYKAGGPRRKDPPTAPFLHEVSIPSPLDRSLGGWLRKAGNRAWQLLGGSPLEAPFIFSRANLAAVRALVEEGGYDMLIVHYAYAGARLEELAPPGVRTVIYTHNLWFKHFEMLRPASLVPWALLRGRFKEREYAILRKFDIVMNVGDYEGEILVADGFDRARVLHAGIAAPRIAAAVAAGPRRHDLLFIGGVSEHNRDAMRGFLEGVWPEVLRRRPASRLAVAGTLCREPFLQGRPNVDLLGFADDLPALYASARLVINPVRVGVGVKVKVIEALGEGCAVLTTTNGAEGIPAPRGEAILVSDDWAEWAEAIVRGLEDDARLQPLREAALAWARENLAPGRVFRGLLAACAGATPPAGGRTGRRTPAASLAR